MQSVAPEPKPRRRRSPLRRFFVGLFILLGIAVLALVLIATFFQDQITRQVISAINANLKTELSVRGSSLTLLKNFPDASVELQGLRLKDLFGGNLLEAENASFKFGLFSLFGQNIAVKSVVFRNGALQLRTDRNGRSGYDIFKDEATSGKKKNAPENELAISLENAEFQDLELVYENRQTRQAAQLDLEKLFFAGNFSAKKFNLSSTAQLAVGLVETDSSRYLAGEKVSWDAVVAVDMAQDLYNLQAVELNVGGNVFAVSGTIVSKPDFTDYDLKLSSQEGDISMVFNLLPDQYHAYFADFSSTGTYSCGGSVKGRLAKNQSPTTSFAVSLRDGKVSSDKLQSPIRDVSFKAIYTARPDGSGQFDISGFRGSFGGQTLNFDLKISNLDDPLVDFRCNGALPLDATYGLFDMPEISGGDGLVRLNALTVNGKYADMSSMNRIPNVQAAGEIVFENAELTYNKVPVVFKSGALRLADNAFSTEKLTVQAGDSDFALDGSAQNLLPVLFSDSLNSTDAFLEFSANLRSGALDIDQILNMFSVQAEASELGGEAALDSLKTAKGIERKTTFDKLKGVFEANIAAFNFNKITGKNFHGKLAFNHNTLLVNGDAETMGGKIHVEGDHHFETQPWLRLRCTVENINLTTCLEQCENFGQDVVGPENLRGTLHGRVAVWAYWDEKGDFRLEKTRALADVKASNGELVRVKMFEEFSKFVHIEDLRRVKFTQLQNYIEITNRRLVLPAMFIQSNAVNLTLSGTHTFDNKIDYKVKVNAGQVLFNRMKKHDSDLDPLPEKNGWLNLFYVIRGDLDNFDMKRSKKSVKAEFERSEARKKTIADALDAEFARRTEIPTPGAEAVAEEN